MLISLVRLVRQRKVVVRRHWRIFLPPPKGGESRLFFFSVIRLFSRYYFDLRRDSLTDQTSTASTCQTSQRLALKI